MCEFCVKHGEGKKWYLNAKNYSDDLLSDVKRRKLVVSAFYRINSVYKRYFRLFKTFSGLPMVKAIAKPVIKNTFIYEHWGQIIPIEDVRAIVEMSSSIVRIPCICRKASTGKEVRTCFLTTLDPKAVGMSSLIDQSFFGGPDVAKFEKMSKDETLSILEEQEQRGMVHSVWTHGTPFIGGICSCDDTGCLGMKMYKEATPLFFRAEYIAESDNGKCVGCKECIKVCQFNAIVLNNNTQKIEIDKRKCYGCGICRSVCKKDAICLRDRSSVLEAKNLW